MNITGMANSQSHSAQKAYGLENGLKTAMRSIETICVLLTTLLLTSSLGCLAEESTGSSDANPALPITALPDGFELLAALPEMDTNVNMTGYITDFYGEKKIDPSDISVGIYQWKADEGKMAYDAKITYLRLMDEEQAENAIYNFKSQKDYIEQLARGLNIFGNATINDHEVLEIMHFRNNNNYKYIYLWNDEDLVVLVEGNNDKSQSLQLASATGL